jgi:hypothetical protein
LRNTIKRLEDELEKQSNKGLFNRLRWLISSNLFFFLKWRKITILWVKPLRKRKNL